MKSPGRRDQVATPVGRLRQFESVWRSLRASPDIVSMVRHGHRIEFLGRGPKLSKPDSKMATELSPSKMKVIKEEVAKLVEKKAMRKLTLEEAHQTRGFYSRLFCVEKSDGSWRPVINLKPMNKYVLKKGSWMETTKDVRQSIRPGMWAATIDLKDAYYHIGELIKENM